MTSHEEDVAPSVRASLLPATGPRPSPIDPRRSASRSVPAAAAWASWPSNLDWPRGQRKRVSGLGAGSRDGGCHSLVLLPFVSLPPECVPARSGATRSGAAAAQGVPFARESSKPGRMTLRGGKVGQNRPPGVFGPPPTFARDVTRRRIADEERPMALALGQVEAQAPGSLGVSREAPRAGAGMK